MTEFHFSPRPNRANEIHWQEWGEAAFSEAQGQDKPILLDIGAVWCHWCHVMDETTYSDPQVIAMLNERFVPVRVDNDQRPDINRRYNLGGWPTTAFLTPNGELLTGGTYIPPQQMQSYLHQVSEAYRQNKESILERVHALERQRTTAFAHRADSAVSPSIVEEVAQEVLDHFDSAYGGFGVDQKFPHTDALELALARYFETRDENFLKVVTVTLTRMAQGGVYDQVAGGFFRYSTTRDWSIPHFEKMLEDNARLLMAYLHAYQVTGRALFRDTAQSLIEYVRSSLYDPASGYFYGSQDADEHYYALGRDERATLPAPYIDRNLYSDWNALMASSFLQAARVLDDRELQSMAVKTLGTLGEEMFDPEKGMYHFRRAGESAPEVSGLLADHAYAAQAYLDAYEVTGRPTYLTHVRILADWALEHLLDHDQSAFLSEPVRPDAFGLLRVADKPLSENAAMADVLIQLAHLTGEEGYRKAAEETLAFFSKSYARSSYMAAGYALAVDRLLSPPLAVTVVGGIDDSLAHELVDAALAQYAPYRLVELLDPERDSARLASLGYPSPHGGPEAYICVGQTCLAPVKEPRQIVESITRVRGQTSLESDNEKQH